VEPCALGLAVGEGQSEGWTDVTYICRVLYGHIVIFSGLQTIRFLFPFCSSGGEGSTSMTLPDSFESVWQF
jgi:hypothetical protein